MAGKKKKRSVEVEALTHDEAKRRNIPTAEFESVMAEEEKSPIRKAYARRNRDLDPQLVWRGKDEQDWSDLVVHAPPLYIQEKVHPKVLVDELLRQSKERAQEEAPAMPDLFADFNGLADPEAKTEFYAHDQNWSNRMILGDSLQVMASLAEREGLRGQVQCIYIDPPYGIKFNSNFQWSTTSRDVKDGKAEHITREPEQVKAFRDTWRDGIHSYLTYLRDRLTVARDLLSESGSIFVQIGDENVHRVRALMDEVFGDKNIVTQVAFRTTTGRGGSYLSEAVNYLLWYARDVEKAKYRSLNLDKVEGSSTGALYTLVRRPDGSYRRLTDDERAAPEMLDEETRIFRPGDITSARPAGENDVTRFGFHGREYNPGRRTFATDATGLRRLSRADRLFPTSSNTIQYIRYLNDYPSIPLTNIWSDTGTGSFTDTKVYVVQTGTKVIQRCILMTTDPGDLVVDPTCGAGTTAYVAEQWGRRWMTVDTSRVALALARARIMGARYPYYFLKDSSEGQQKEAETTRTAPKTTPTHGDLRQGFVYERVPHITLKLIANNTEIDVIWEKFQAQLEPLRAELNAALGKTWEEWEIPRDLAEVERQTGKGKKTMGVDIGATSIGVAVVGDDVADLHAKWWELRIARQKEIDGSIAAKAEFEYLYDKPYIDGSRIRVAGPFTVESLSPHRVLAVDQDDELIDALAAAEGQRAAPKRASEEADFAHVILENLKTSGVQQAHKEDKIDFTSIVGWPGRFICAEGRFLEGDKERRAGIFVGPEFGTVARPDLVAAAREAGDAGFDVLIACAFNYDAHSADFDKLGRIPILKARMNADLHMADELKNTGKGNLFVIFGEPDIEIKPAGKDQIQVRIKGVDVFHPQSGEIESSGPDGIACWFIDSDYNEESFFVRQAYFLGANDPYKALKTTLKAEIDEEAWESLHSDTSRPFAKPKSGRIAVKVINHLGDEVMKVFSVG